MWIYMMCILDLVILAQYTLSAVAPKYQSAFATFLFAFIIFEVRVAKSKNKMFQKHKIVYSHKSKLDFWELLWCKKQLQSLKMLHVVPKVSKKNFEKDCRTFDCSLKNHFNFFNWKHKKGYPFSSWFFLYHQFVSP